MKFLPSKLPKKYFSLDPPCGAAEIETGLESRQAFFASLRRDAKEIRTLPDSRHISGRTEFVELRPVLQSMRRDSSGYDRLLMK
jgi:hypothetical protein